MQQEKLRVKVRSWEGETVNVEDENGAAFTLALGKDHAYLSKILTDACTLQLIGSGLRAGVLHPRHIIFEPDYLVDVTTVTRCFDLISENPMHNLLRKIKDFEATPATLLGNYAGALLDEEVHGRAEDGDSLGRFLRDNAVEALSCLDEAGLKKLKADGLSQRSNIHQMLFKDLPRQAAAYRPDRVLLEPSFFSPILGLQGRMDFFQQDGRVLIEQKSGKVANDYQLGRPGVRKQASKEHAVQLQLYRALLQYGYGVDGKKMDSFLLYSKYPDGLLRCEEDEDLLQRALGMRNRLVRYEMHYRDGGMPELLEEYVRCPEKICDENLRGGKFWAAFKAPEYEKLFAPLRNASPLEKAYFYRFMTFLSREHWYGKMEPVRFASAAVKRDEGELYDGLTLALPPEGPVTTLRFCSSSRGASVPPANFRLGDVVVAYAYDGEPSPYRSVVFRGTLSAIEEDTLTVCLRDAQGNPSVFDTNRRWALEHDYIESSVNALYRGLTLLLDAPKARRDWLLMQQKPSVDTSLSLKGSYGDFDELMLRVKQARDFFLIIGPPGTGKTSFGMLYTLQEALRSGQRVLAAAYTNRAVDEICAKLDEAGIDFLRLGHASSCPVRFRSHLLGERLPLSGAQACPAPSAPTSAAASLAAISSIVGGSRVLVGTTTTLGAQTSLLRRKAFDLAIIDEASQILEPHLAALLGAKCAGKARRPFGAGDARRASGDDQADSAIRKFVLIGDHKQLPAVVRQSARESEVDEPLLRQIGLRNCRLSLFERLLGAYGDDLSVVGMLTRQGRMHPSVARYASESFYEGLLESAGLPHQRENVCLTGRRGAAVEASACPLDTQRLLFIAVPGQTDTATRDPLPEGAFSDGTPSKVNQAEAEVIARCIERIREREGDAFDPATSVGVIVPYRHQIAAVRAALLSRGIPVPPELSIDTVERFQGSQRETILYGFTASHPKQLEFLSSQVFEEGGRLIDRKLNVAMTRARSQLILIGNPAVLSGSPAFSALLDFCRAQDILYSVSEAFAK